MAKRAHKAKQTTTNISMPASMRAEVESQMRVGAFGNVSEFVRYLVRENALRIDYEQRRLRAMLDQGDKSGPLVRADEKFWDNVRGIARTGGSKGRRRAG